MKVLLLLVSLTILLAFCPTTLHAQGHTVTGKITSAENKPLAGVSVRVKGASAGASSDEEGNYRITVADASGILVFSSIGYTDEEVPIGSQTTINVSLKESSRQLNDIVVIGYGAVRKKDLTGSVAQVRAKEIGIFANASPVQALQGRAAGVQVIQNSGAPGGNISVRIRGTNSVQGSNEPLYVVDGFPLNGPLSLLNNADIESIEVLKDASAIAIYGSRGANGVVLVTTKKGRAGAVRVDYESGYSIQSVTKKLKLLSPRQYAEFYNEQARNDNIAPYFTQNQVDSLGGVKGTDWQNLVLRNAPQWNNVLTVSGGSGKTRFSVSGGIFKQEGIVRKSDYNRYTLRANIDQDISSQLALSYSANLSRINSARREFGQGNRGSSLFSAMVSAPATLEPYTNGIYRNLATAYPFISNVLRNPVLEINETSDDLRSNRILANAALTYKPLPGLSVRISGGIESSDNQTTGYRNGLTISNGASTNTTTGIANFSSSNVTSLLNENVINYIREFGDHSLTATAGLTYQNFKAAGLSGGGSGFISNVQGPFDLGAAGTPGVPNSSFSEWTLLSGLGRLNYGFRDKYLATISFRADGSSRYSEGNKWGYFPAMALAWRLSKESFFQNQSFLTDLKFRGSWGRTGSTAISPYQTLNQLNTDQVIFGDVLFVTYAPGSRLPGPLKWETTDQTDLGLDFAFLKGRIRGSIDYYIKNTSDLLNTVSLPSSLGYTNTIRNIGKIQNKGLEFAVDADVIRGVDFRWDVAANISFNRNKVIKLYNGEDVLGGSINITVVNDYINRLREGEPIGRFYGFTESGYDANGKITYVDQDKNGVINANDKTFIGNPNPDFIYGFNSNVSYKNFELSLFVQGSQGNDIFNLSAVNQTLDYGFGLNMPLEVYETHWTPTNTNAKYPRISRTTAPQISTRFVEDGSYVRLKNIQLAYNLPVQNYLKWFRSAQLYVSGQNILTFTNYSGFDPEINSYGSGNSIMQGIDHYSYPNFKAYTVGLRCSF